MAKQLVTDIVINLAGNLANKARQYGQSMTQFAANNQRAMNMLKMSASAAGRGIDALGNRYVALGAAVVGGSAVRGFSQLDRRISRIAIAAEISREKSAELYDEIQRVSNLKGIRIDPAEATSAIEEILTKTGDLEYAIANLPNIAAVIQATGAGGLEVGGIFTEFKKLGIDTQKAAMQAIDTLNIQGKSGAFTLPGLAKEGPRLFAAYAATGRKGTDAVNEMGAALQNIRRAVGSDAEAATVFEALLRDLTRPQTVQALNQLSKGKINVFDPEQLKQGKEVMMSLPELMSQIVIQSKGLSKNIAMLNLSDEAIRGFKLLKSEFMDTGDIKAFDQFLQMSGDGSTTLDDAAVAANDFAASLQLVSNSWSQFSNQQLAGPVAELANAINSLDPDSVQQWLEAGKNIALVTGGLVLAKKTFDAVRWGKDTWDALKPGKGKGGAGGMGGAMADLGATPVYVVNMPGGGFDIPTGGPDKPTGKVPKAFNALKKMAPGLLATGSFGLIYAASQSEEAQRLKAESDAAQVSKATLPNQPMLSNKDAFAMMAEQLRAEGATGLAGNRQNAFEQKVNASLDINVRDDRITVRTRDTAPGLKVNVDNGPSLMP